MEKYDLKNMGLDAETEEAAKNSGLAPARVLAQYKGQYTLLTENGEVPAKVSGKLRYEAATPEQYPTVGDWVLAENAGETSGEAYIARVLPRKSCLIRKAAGTGESLQVIAANMDIVFICMSANRDFNLRRMERYLSLVWESRATPVAVLTKCDLTDDLEARLLELEAAAPGVDIAAVTTRTEDGLDPVRRYLKTGVTIAFIGSSGVGKSTIVNRLMGKDVLFTREVREDDDRGRHSTTNRQMFTLPGGGVVIDTPGMRELQLYGADLTKAFADIGALALNCRFGDCRHVHEPGCAVKKAVEEGVLPPERLESYRKLLNELEFEENKRVMTAAQAEKAKAVRMMGSLRAQKQIVREKYKDK